MAAIFDPSTVVLPSEERARAVEPTLMFGRNTIRVVYYGANVVGAGLFFWGSYATTELLTPVSPDFRAFMIGVGVFLGVLVATLEREAWLLGLGGSTVPRGMAVPILMMALVAAGGFGGDFVAHELWQWRAFSGVRPVVNYRTFTVTSRYSGRHQRHWLNLLDASNQHRFSINCTDRMYDAVQDGSRLTLPVETGRGGVERMTLPAVKDLRRG